MRRRRRDVGRCIERKQGGVAQAQTHHPKAVPLALSVPLSCTTRMHVAKQSDVSEHNTCARCGWQHVGQVGCAQAAVGGRGVEVDD
jgi:hypothetical protein